MFEVVGNTHMHTPYSDGAKWHAEIAQDAINAGLDFIVVTDHNVWIDEIEGYYENEAGRVLLISGEEVHNPRRRPQANHFLAIGAEKELSQYAADPQKLIDETRSAGGFGFLAHPFDRDAPHFNESNLGWQDWDIDGYTGLEIWNYMSNFKSHLDNRLKALRVATNPERYIVGPLPETLAKWDELLAQGKRIVAIGGSDAHAFKYNSGPLHLELFPYEFLFRAVNMHLLLREELNGNMQRDKRLIIEALGMGKSWVGYDMAYSSKGFRFTGQGRTKGIMGDEIKLDTGVTLQVIAPTRCDIRMLLNGQAVAEITNGVNLTYIPLEPGAYRVECTIKYQKKKRGWIYSNPIYLL